MQPSSLPVVLVTGASTGIGLELVRQLQQRAYRIVATARRESLRRFEEQGITEHERCWIHPLEVTSASEQATLIEAIEQRWGRVDILINNAAISFRATIEDLSHDEELQQFETNYFGPMGLIRLVLPGMRTRRRGRIINISSVGGIMAMPTMGAYSASKFALEGASEALWYEMRPWGIQVVLIEPGFVHSNSFRNVKYSIKSQHSSQGPQAPYHAYYRFMTPFIERMMERAWATPASIAGQILKAMEAEDPPLRVPATLDAKLFFWLRRWLPRRFYHMILYRNLPSLAEWSPDAKNPL